MNRYFFLLKSNSFVYKFFPNCHYMPERKPQKADSWFENHQATCGGTFVKISEPSNKEAKQTEKKEHEGKRKMENEKSEKNMTLDKWIDKRRDEKSLVNKRVRVILD